jgi:hypothetical protein
LNGIPRTWFSADLQGSIRYSGRGIRPVGAVWK